MVRRRWPGRATLSCGALIGNMGFLKILATSRAGRSSTVAILHNCPLCELSPLPPAAIYG
jgi:hypothetical protein